MKLKLKHIVMCPATGEYFLYAKEIEEYDELPGGSLLIKSSNGIVGKYVGIPYVIVREPA